MSSLSVVVVSSRGPDADLCASGAPAYFVVSEGSPPRVVASAEDWNLAVSWPGDFASVPVNASRTRVVFWHESEADAARGEVRRILFHHQPGGAWRMLGPLVTAVAERRTLAGEWTAVNRYCSAGTLAEVSVEYMNWWQRALWQLEAKGAQITTGNVMQDRLLEILHGIVAQDLTQKKGAAIDLVTSLEESWMRLDAAQRYRMLMSLRDVLFGSDEGHEPGLVASLSDTVAP